LRGETAEQAAAGRADGEEEADVKICVSLTEPTAAATAARMAELAPVADLFEVRADLLCDRDLRGLQSARTRPILLTCRPAAEGGHWPDADAEGRLRLLREAAALGFDLVDVEARAGFEDLVMSRAGHGLVLSWHELGGMPEDLDGLYARMAARRPDVVKIAVNALSVADLGRVLAFTRRHATTVGHGERPAAGRPALVAIAMGPLGVASRILGGRYGAPFTFASPFPGQEAAPGQLTAAALLGVYRARDIGPETRLYGLVGTDVLRSLSPAVHNAAFAAAGIDARYVPLQAESLEAFCEALPSLGLSGFSVTRPYKTKVLGQLASVAPEAARAGSVNTVVMREEGGLAGSSTDGEGVLVPLRKRTALEGRRVAILGAGGAARAAAFALVNAGARVTVLARRSEQSAQVAAATGCSAAPLEAAVRLEWDVLVNGTPVGSGSAPGALPVPESALRPGAVVFDMVYEPRETPLLAAARGRGCTTIEGVEMLVAQAAVQFETWTGTAAPVDAMTRAALDAIGGKDASRRSGA
jgi:3-dehydroquinate dehydratase/shikimate dehydrogenase